ncbi:hypothetical protein ONA91_13820 [Micromonospora sp. DR5-3]|uniref:hypothetical protein n=1 Tax=unclassified Micromonospora TaxID=2617518 RepID=UPI0021029572|nr:MULTISPECIES: hypothetical protein [unclassified Micromonospora]MCW3815532.1 hypothetical protein [Micromonospora sp. DR5-3]
MSGSRSGAVVVHAAEEWPAGPKCCNDGAAYPCRLHRRVLAAHGLNERQIDALVRHGNPFVHMPSRSYRPRWSRAS